MSTVFDGVDSLLTAAGTDLGSSDWFTIGGQDVERFAVATGAGAGTDREAVPPFMLVALTNRFLPDLMQVRGASSGVNYGTGMVRFGSPIHEGDRIRASAAIGEAAEVTGGVQVSVEIRVEAEGQAEPACVVDSLSRWLR